MEALALSLENKRTNGIRDASYSYLDKAGETFPRKFEESNRCLGQKEHRKKEDDGEIGVFTAEKYFSGEMEDISPRLVRIATKNSSHQHTRKNVDLVSLKNSPRQHVRKDVDLVSLKSKLSTTTPSLHSESSSSRNSQRALLQTLQRNTSQKKESMGNGRRFLACIACNCSDKDSVEVSDHIDAMDFSRSPRLIQKQHSRSCIQDETRSQDLSKLAKDASFRPSLHSVSEKAPVKIQRLVDEELIPRKSIEVLGSPVQETRNKQRNKRSELLSWEAIPRTVGLDLPAKSGRFYHDYESDASSDLFEIENLPGNVPFLLGQETDRISGCLSPNCYAPSEASIEWSVVTESAADFSVMSDYEERRAAPMVFENPPKNTSPRFTSPRTRSAKETPRWCPAIMLVCKGQKSVSVVGDEYKHIPRQNYPQSRRASEYSAHKTSSQAETKLKGTDRHGQDAYATCVFPRSNSLHVSHQLYIK